MTAGNRDLAAQRLTCRAEPAGSDAHKHASDGDSAVPSGLAAWHRRHRHINWVLTDQALVSGCNFVTGIVLARFLGPESYGVFVLLYSALLYANTFQAALIISPMLSTAPQLDEPERQLYFRSVFTLQLALSATLAAVVAMLGLAYARWKNLPGLEANLIPLALVVVSFQLQDWLRRYYFAQERGRSVLVNDVVCYVGQTVTLIGLLAAGLLTVESALWVIAVVSILAFSVGWSRERVVPAWREAAATLREGWRRGRDYLLAGQFYWMGSQGVLLVGASYLGAQTVGGIRAAQNIVGPINIVYQVMENVLPVRAARRFSVGGRARLIAYLRRVTLAGAVSLIPVFVAIAFYSSELMRLIYGLEYSAFAPLVVWQLVYLFISFFYRQAVFYHRSVQHTRSIAWSAVIVASCAVTASLVLTHDFEAPGIMCALVAGQLLGLWYLVFAAFGDARVTRATPLLPERSIIAREGLARAQANNDRTSATGSNRGPVFSEGGGG
jgi:O-antigen/teichoic acid export membrane protein